MSIGSITNYPFEGNSIIIPCVIHRTNSDNEYSNGIIIITDGWNVLLYTPRAYTYTSGVTYTISITARNI